MSARAPATVDSSLAELALHGGATGPHRDGWGIAFVQDGDALVLREPEAASESRWIPFLRGNAMRSPIVVAHLRKATQGPRTLRNTQPFARELGGRVHVFSHNGMLPKIEDDARFASRRFKRVGDTDSEQAFCALLERIATMWEAGVPPVDARVAAIAAFAHELRTLGPANFVYTDGDAVFAHGHRRRTNDGEIRPPGLHVLCRTCAETQEVALVASVPLTSERWRPLDEGEIVVLRDGRVAERV